MSDTPRTDGVIHNIAELGVFARQLERELNATQAAIRQQQLLDEEILRLRERVKRLEEEGREVRECAAQLGWTSANDPRWVTRAWKAVENWDKEANP